MNIVAGVMHPQTIALALPEMVGGGHGIAGSLARKNFVVYGPPIESAVGGVALQAADDDEAGGGVSASAVWQADGERRFPC